MLPAQVLARQVDDEEALRVLTLRAAAALGVGTEADIRDYFRLAAGQVKPAIAELVAEGELECVDVDGWSAPGYLRPGRPIPRLDRGTALLCPFEPLIFFRPRVQRLFEFHYRIDVYTPAAQRRYGYYVWPFLLDGQLVGRVDLKADREHDALHVVGAFVESDRSPARVAAALAPQLATMAAWIGLGGVTVGERGDLVDELRVAEIVVAPELSDGSDLLLRRPRPDDIRDIMIQCADPEMQRWTVVPVPYCESDAQQFLGTGRRRLV